MKCVDIFHTGTKTTNQQDKLISEINALNAQILNSAGSDYISVYKALKIEEHSLLSHSMYYNSQTIIPAEIKLNIDTTYGQKIKSDKLKTDEDYYFFYINQLRFFYVQVSQKIYTETITNILLQNFNGSLKSFARAIINSYFPDNYSGLQAMELTATTATELLSIQPWKNFPWEKAVQIHKSWTKKEATGIRELDRYMSEVAEKYELTPEEANRIFRALRPEAEKKICCRSAGGCRNCPLNRHYFLD